MSRLADIIQNREEHRQIRRKLKDDDFELV